MPDQDELERVRARLHKLADIVQVHEGKLQEHDLRMVGFTAEMKAVRADMATGSQVDAAVKLLTLKIENAEKTMSLQLALIQESFAPVRKGFYWAVGIVITSVLVGLMTLILRK